MKNPLLTPLALYLGFLASCTQVAAPITPATFRADLGWPTHIDYLTYASALTSPSWSFRLQIDGEVQYHFGGAPFTNSGGQSINKTWRIPEAESRRLLAAWVDGGHESPTPVAPFVGFPFQGIELRADGWSHGVDPRNAPPSCLAELQRLIAEAHPEAPAATQPAATNPAPQTAGISLPTQLDMASYKVLNGEGAWWTLTVSRDGGIFYTHYSGSPNPRGLQEVLKYPSHIPPDDAARILDHLVDAGLLKLQTLPYPSGNTAFTGISFEFSANGWIKAAYYSDVPESITRDLAPLIASADAALKLPTQPATATAPAHTVAALQRIITRDAWAVIAGGGGGGGRGDGTVHHAYIVYQFNPDGSYVKTAKGVDAVPRPEKGAWELIADADAKVHLKLKSFSVEPDKMYWLGPDTFIEYDAPTDQLVFSGERIGGRQPFVRDSGKAILPEPQPLKP